MPRAVQIDRPALPIDVPVFAPGTTGYDALTMRLCRLDVLVSTLDRDTGELGVTILRDFIAEELARLRQDLQTFNDAVCCLIGGAR